MQHRHLAILFLSALLAPGLGVVRGQDEPPRDLGLVEKAERQLVQIDVTVLGPAERVAALTAEDFRVAVSHEPIDGFVVDRVCSDGAASARALAPGSLAGADAGAARAPTPGTSYLFYFDQPHLTLVGRERSIEVARELIDLLIRGANRATIVSSGQEVRTFAEFTSDREVLLAALDRLEKDARQWDPFATQEDARVAQVQGDLDIGVDSGSIQARLARQDDLSEATLEAFPGGAPPATQAQKKQQQESRRQLMSAGVNHARLAAQRFQREEKWHTERALSRFALVLGRLADVDPPKAVIYFADRMRSNAGDHYVQMFPQSTDRGRKPDLLGGREQVLAGTDVPTYDQVIAAAATHGARLYTVQAEGLTLGVSRSVASSSSAPYNSLGPLSSTKRFSDAKNSLAGFALETGGRAFLNGVAPARIARQMESDLECVYLISFDAQGLPQDRWLPLAVSVRDPKLDVRARTRLVVQSESARLASRLTNAFSGAGQLSAGARLRTAVIPTGFRDGKYSALVQVRVPGTELPEATWDVGLSTLSRGRAVRQASGRVSLPAPGVPVVFEAEMEFAPGPYEISAVAHETGADVIVSDRVEGEWPDPEDEDATVGPIALVQPAEAVFVREGERRSLGSLATTADDFVQPDRPTALVAIVCRDRPRKLGLEVERLLAGETAVGFPPLEVEAGEDRCFLLSDVIPANVMSEGAFTYSVRVLGDEGELAGAEREFAVIRTAEAVPEAEPAPSR